MEYDISHQNTSITVSLSGQFTFADNQKFRNILEVVANGQTQAIELNFSEVNFIDSAGLGMLLLLRDECAKHNISLTIRGTKGQVDKIFVISKFDQLFTIHS